MAKPQITGVTNPNTRITEQWWFVPSPADASASQLLQYREEAHKAFVGFLPEGATANALEVFGQVASEKPPGASEEYGAGWWFKPKTPLFGPTTRPPAVGAFDTIDDLRKKPLRCSAVQRYKKRTNLAAHSWICRCLIS